MEFFPARMSICRFLIYGFDERMSIMGRLVFAGGVGQELRHWGMGRDIIEYFFVKTTYEI